MTKTLYDRLGGYDAIVAVVEDLLERLTADEQLARFWRNRGEDGVLREKQLLVDFLCSSAGGPLHYVGRSLKTSHKGMGVTELDWHAFVIHLKATLFSFEVADQEQGDVLAFVDAAKMDIVDA
jgi:hemoglobin